MKKQIALITILCFAQGTFSMESRDLDAQLYAAAKRGDKEEVLNLLQMGADVNARGDDASALAAAVLHGHTEIVHLLIEFCADVDARDSWGSTPLMTAVSRGYWHTAKLLIEAGIADVNAYDDRKETTPLILALRGGRTDIPKLLLDTGADMNATTSNGQSALMHAAHEGHAGTVEFLLTYIPAAEQDYIRNTFHALYALKVKKGAPLPRDVRNLLRDTIIAELVQGQMNRVVQLISHRDNVGYTARDLALFYNHQAIIDLLDLKNPISRERIRKQIENNIKRILFGEPKESPGVTRELTLEEAFGSWLSEPESGAKE